MKQEISLSQIAIKQIEDGLSAGKSIELRVIRDHLVIFEVTSKKKYDLVVTSL